MDKRINFINALKKRLNDYIILDNKKKSILHKKKQTQTTNPLILGAQMLSENIQSGLVLDETTFISSNIYAEYSKLDSLSFHIYPTMSSTIELGKENLDEQRKKEESKLVSMQTKVQL